MPQKGSKKSLKLMRFSVMMTRGNGSEPGSKPERCPSCNGTGMETVSTGPFMMRSTCRWVGVSWLVFYNLNICICVQEMFRERNFYQESLW